jgi:hypothetical protein
MVDYLVAVCRACGHTVHVSTVHQGRRAKCPQCDAIIEIPKNETSIRIRSDRELTREAREKAGKGPESDPNQHAQSRSRHQTGKYRRVVPKKSGTKRMGLILTLVATVLIVAGILVVLLKNSGDSKETGGPKSGVKTPPPPPPPPPPDPRAADKEAFRDRVKDYVRDFNSNNLNRVAAHYANADIDAMRKAFGEALPSMDSEIAYEKVEIKSIDFQDPNVSVKFTVDRVVRNKESGASETKEGVERLIVWTKVGEKYLITSPPQF